MEVCVDSIASALEAADGGASRLELCSALLEDGLTPSIGLFEVVKSLVSIPVFVMIRPKLINNYIYSDNEILEMETDIKMFKSKGADGFAFGALTSKGCVDENVCQRLLAVSAPLPTTFHRAFDLTINPFESLETIIQLGFKRILTSGQESNVLEGVDLVRDLVEHSAGRIIIMPGAGISEQNLSYILETTSANEFHSSAKKIVTLPKFKNSDEPYKIFITCKKRVQIMVDISKNICCVKQSNQHLNNL